MLAYSVAATINYPSIQAQRLQLAAHAGNALSVAGLVFAAGIFIGILSGTKMVDAMSATVIAAIPAAWGPYMAPITALISAPFTFFISNDAFYRSEEHTSELQSLMRISYAVFCLKKKT